MANVAVTASYLLTLSADKRFFDGDPHLLSYHALTKLESFALIHPLRPWRTTKQSLANHGARWRSTVRLPRLTDGIVLLDKLGIKFRPTIRTNTVTKLDSSMTPDVGLNLMPITSIIANFFAGGANGE